MSLPAKNTVELLATLKAVRAELRKGGTDSRISADLLGVRSADDLRFLLASIVETSNDAIVGMTVRGTIVTWNPAAEQLYGYTTEEVIGQPISILVPPDRTDAVLSLIRRIRQGDRLFHYETAQLRNDGVEVSVSLTLSPIRDDAGNITALSMIAHDITEQKQTEHALRQARDELEQRVQERTHALADANRRLQVDLDERRRLADQLRQAQKMEAIGRLAGGVAHDFNNLLTVIMGYGELLLTQIDPEHVLRSSVDEIVKAAERAAALTRQLLAFSRRQILSPKFIDLNASVASMHRMLRRLIGEDIDLVTVSAPELGPVKADAGQVDQVLMNLVVNARDAMPKGGQLTLETANVELDETYTRDLVDVRPGRYVMLAVSDTGCGMTREVQAHLFEPFFTTKPQGVGTGLGLSTTYGIVKQSGGHIAVYSEPGKGTTFKIYLPRVDEIPSTEQGDAAPNGVHSNQTVLLVEDESQVRTLIREVLSAKGYTILEADSDTAAEEICRQHPGPIHLLIADVVMPHSSGTELAQRLRAFQPEMRTLYISGYADNAVVRHGILEAGTPFLQKPFTPAALQQKVLELLAKAEKSPD